MRHRLLFYSHDTFGLGHFRRSLTVASHIARRVDDVTALMLTGLDSAASFEAPHGVDFVKLPGVWKSGDEHYSSRHLRVSFSRVQRLREQLVRSVARAFHPAMFVVDNAPLGVHNDLLPTLRYLKKRQPGTRVVLTLRDVLDDPGSIVASWKKSGVYEALEEYYDEIWVAGCREVFDPVSLYEFSPAVAERTRFCGYVARKPRQEETSDIIEEFSLEQRPFVVVSCGGGGDGVALVDSWIEAGRRLARDGIRSVVFLGPDMPSADRRELRRRMLACGDDFLVFDYRPDLVCFLGLAAASVSMAGYNTVCELLSLEVPAVLVPRVEPRVEQLLRARAFEKNGVVEVVEPHQLGPDSLEAAVRRCLQARASGQAGGLPEGVDFSGLRRMERQVRRHLQRENN